MSVLLTSLFHLLKSIPPDSSPRSKRRTMMRYGRTYAMENKKPCDNMHALFSWMIMLLIWALLDSCSHPPPHQHLVYATLLDDLFEAVMLARPTRRDATSILSTEMVQLVRHRVINIQRQPPLSPQAIRPTTYLRGQNVRILESDRAPTRRKNVLSQWRDFGGQPRNAQT